MNDTKFWNPSTNEGTPGKIIGSFSSIKPAKKNGNDMTTKKPSKAKKIAITALISVGTVLLVLAVALYITVFRPLSVVLAKVNEVKADGSKITEAISNRDLISLEKAVADFETDLKELKTVRDANVGWMRNFGLTKEYYADSEHFINAGNYAITAVREAVTLIEPFADAAGLKVREDQKVVNTGLANAVATWIGLMPKVSQDMDKVIAPLSLAGAELKDVKADKYPESFRGTPIRSTIKGAQNALNNLEKYAPDIKNALNIVPGLLGVGNGEKRYMVIMQNDKELRPTGGFWTNYATFRLNNALLVNQDFTSKDMYSVDLTLDKIDAYYTFGAPPFPYGKYLKVERWYARDANTSPDLPTSIDNFMKSYKLAMTIDPLSVKPVDGIATIDTQVLRELMEVTGPVTVNGTTYNSENVVLELERIASLALREQAGRKGVLGDLMKQMLKNVFESETSLWSKLIEKAVDLTARKHIQFYSFNVDAQALLEKYNFAGRIVDPVEGDYSYIVSTNLGGDKTNWFVTKEVEHTLAKDNGKWLRTVKIKYSYPQPAEDFAPFVKRFRDWVRVYAPLNSTLVSVDGSEDGNGTDTERNKTYFWGYLEMGPGESKEITFKYYLPDNVIKGSDYNLYLQKQSGVNGETYHVTVGGKTETFALDMDKQMTKKL